MKFVGAAYSVKGIREINEDSFILATKTNTLGKSFTTEVVEGKDDKPYFFAVADGMGGQGSGEKASHMVVSSLLTLNKNISSFDTKNLTEEIEVIHSKVVSENSKMGTTLSGIIFQKDKCGIVNLGDSRTYRLRKDFFLQMTNDDSLCSFDSNAPTNIVTNGIGGGLKSISVNTRFSDKILLPGDIFLICSDGVYRFVSEEKMEEILSKNISEEEMVSEIVKIAIQKGTDDNCTAVIVVFKE